MVATSVARQSALVTAVTSRGLNVGKFTEVEISDCLKRLSSRAVAQTIGQCGKPLGVLGL